MNDIRFVSTGPGRGKLYINGHEVPGVLAIEPDLFTRDSIATMKVELAVSSFVFEPESPKP